MKLSKITFGFENCETLTIDGKYVGSFLVEDLTTAFRRIACNSFDKVEIAHTFVIEIAAGADGEHKPFGIKDLETTKFKRLLMYNDITSIDFTLGEGYETIEASYWLCWVGQQEEVNEGQHTYLSELGNLYIVVSDTKKFEDFFDKETINDKEAVEFDFKMYDIPY